LINIPDGATSDWVLQEFFNSVEGIQLRPQLIQQETEVRFIRRYVNQSYDGLNSFVLNFSSIIVNGCAAPIFIWQETRPGKISRSGLKWSWLFEAVGSEAQCLAILINYAPQIVGNAIRYFGLYFDSDFDFGGRQCRQVLQYFLADLPHIATCAIRVDLDDIEEATR
jgi:hypothetical protein